MQINIVNIQAKVVDPTTERCGMVATKVGVCTRITNSIEEVCIYGIMQWSTHCFVLHSLLLGLGTD